MEKVKIVWSGITGRTGVQALKVSKRCDFAEIVAGICRSDSKYYNYEQLDNIKEDFDVVVDFSHKDSFDKVLDFALEVKKPLVIGTAGLTTEQEHKIKEASKIIPIFKGGNFRFSVKEFIDKVVQYAKNIDNDLTLIETHYKTKKIPSETAKEIARLVLKETGNKVIIKSFLEYDELINDWKIGPLHCRVNSFDSELAEGVLKIALLLKDKDPNGIYTLDKLVN